MILSLISQSESSKLRHKVVLLKAQFVLRFNLNNSNSIRSKECSFDHFSSLCIFHSLNILNLNILNWRVEMNNCLGSRRDQFFSFGKIQDMKLSLENIANLIVIWIIADDVTSQDIIFFNSFHFKFDVLSCWGIRNSNIAGIIDFLNFKWSFWRKKGNLLILNNSSRFNFSINVKLSLFFHFVNNWNS